MLVLENTQDPGKYAEGEPLYTIKHFMPPLSEKYHQKGRRKKDWIADYQGGRKCGARGAPLQGRPKNSKEGLIKCNFLNLKGIRSFAVF